MIATFKGRTPSRPISTQRQDDEGLLAQDELLIERKKFKLFLKENPRGVCLVIREETANGRSDSIIAPASGLRALEQAIGKLAGIAEKNKSNNHKK